tara:strand:- start:659 stop:1726 length:1068 start_codon:yes stop_codon:yes gene_type:complete
MNESFSRKEILKSIKEKKKLKSKLFTIIIVILIIIISIPIASYSINVWIPYQKTALKVEEKEFTRKDLVDFIRFNQRLSEEQGNQFDLGSSLFQSLQLLAENEIAYLSANEYKLSVEDWEIDEAFFLKLGLYNNFSLETVEDEEVLKEKKVQFLNQVQMNEDKFKEIVRKSLFREKLRRELSREIPSLQEHKYVFEIALEDISQSNINKIQKEINVSNNIGEVVKKYSIDPNSKRGSGDFGWIPKGIKPELDILIFGNGDNNFLKPKELSEPYIDQENSVFKLYVISDVKKSYELSEENFEQISNNVLKNFFNDRSRLVDMQYGLDNETFNWINGKVQAASLFNDNNLANDIINK